MSTEEELEKVVNMPDRIRVHTEMIAGVFALIYVVITFNSTAFFIAGGVALFVHLLFEWSYNRAYKQLNEIRAEKLKKQREKLGDK